MHLERTVYQYWLPMLNIEVLIKTDITLNEYTKALEVSSKGNVWNCTSYVLRDKCTYFESSLLLMSYLGASLTQITQWHVVSL